MAPSGRVVVAAACFAALVVACGLFPDVGGLGGGDGAVEAGGADAGSACVGNAGPAAVAVGSFCVDSTEVTNAEYAAFLATHPDPAGQLPYCSWNTSFAPSTTPPPGSDDYPVVWVDWCDAYAYCQWAGKRLCGRLGGGALAPGGMNDPGEDEWYVACSLAGARTYPYGDAFDPTACNGPEHDAGSVLPASSLPECVGGTAGVLDMVGNADEWIDSCESQTDGDDGGLDDCERRSGSWEDPSGASQTCAFHRTGSRDFSDHDVGFRCCSDLAP